MEEWEDIQIYVPESTICSGCILVTTQKPGDETGWSEHNVKLCPFDTTLGSRLLLSSLKVEGSEEENKDLAVEITEIIWGLPLYLNQARGFINFSKSSLEEYLSLVQKTSSIPKNTTADKNLGYDKPPNEAFDITLTRLTVHTLDLLNILAFLNPEGVPEDMIFVEDQPDDELAFLDPYAKLEMIGDLAEYQLVKRETAAGDPCLSMHRSLQRALLDKLNR